MGTLFHNFIFMPPKLEREQEIDTENDIMLSTRHGSKIQVKSLIKNDKFLYLLMSHGNAEEVYGVFDWVSNTLQNYLNVNFIMYEYTGYGQSHDFSPSEEYCYNDADAVYNYMVNTLKIPPKRIVIFGRSLGSGPSCYLAEKYPVLGLIINSGYMSIYRVAFKFRWTLPGDIFPNIDRIKNIKCPVCIMHSIKDEIIPFYHAKELYKNTPNKFDPLFIDGTNHNTIDKLSDDCFKHMEKFFKYLDKNYQVSSSKKTSNFNESFSNNLEEE